MNKIEIIYEVEDCPRVGYGTAGSAAIDLRACFSETVAAIPAGGVLACPSGIRIWIKDPGYVGIVAPRSSMGTKGLVLANTIGVIDSDYQGPIVMQLMNRTSKSIVINRLDRVAQLLIVPVQQVTYEEVEKFSDATARGVGGYGSTGVK